MGKVLDDLINSKCNQLQEAEGVSKDDIKLYQNALKEKLKEDIKGEIIKEEAIRLTEEYKKNILDEKIKQLEILFFTGIVVSFFIGLLVNQVTDLISIWKGTLNKEVFNFTLTMVGVISIITLGLIIYLLFRSIIDFIKGEKNEKNTDK